MRNAFYLLACGLVLAISGGARGEDAKGVAEPQWSFNATNIEACSCAMFCPCYFVAKLDDGKAAEIVLKRNQGITDEPIMLKNIRFWGAPRNEGFAMMGNEIEAYRVGDHPFEHKATNGFTVTIDINSQDVAAKSES